MKAIWGRPALYIVVENDGDYVKLEPMEGSEDQQFWLELNDPDLILDPTDDEVDALKK